MVILYDTVTLGGCPLAVNSCPVDDPLYDVLPQLWEEEVGLPRVWLFVIVMPLTAFLLDTARRCMSDSLGSQLVGGGSAQALAAVASGEPLHWKVVVGRVVYTSLYIGCGHPLGNEGPAIHIGAATASSMATFAGYLHPEFHKVATMGGTAAALAAAFNTPIAGITFVVEESLHLLTKRTVWLFTLAPIFATSMRRLLLGNYPLIHVIEDEHWADLDGEHRKEAFARYILGAVVGLFSGLLAALFQRSFFATKAALKRCGIAKSRLLLPCAGVVSALLCGVVFNQTTIPGSAVASQPSPAD
jgi:CIC family chloride channel protein